MINDQSGVAWSKAANDWCLNLSSISFLLGPSRDPGAFELERIHTEICARYNSGMMVWRHCTEVCDLRDWHKSEIRKHERDFKFTSAKVTCNCRFSWVWVLSRVILFMVRVSPSFLPP